MGDPNRPLVDEVHRLEPLGNCRKSAAQFLGQLPGGHKWIGEDQLMKPFLINRAESSRNSPNLGHNTIYHVYYNYIMVLLKING